MSPVTQALCAFLALLLALAGGPLDLCACGPAGHGAACEAVAPCCPPAAPPSCCSEEPTPSGPSGASLERARCACPEVDLSTSPAESAADPTAPQRTCAHPALTAHAVALEAAVPSLAELLAAPPRDEVPRPPGRALYLANHVLRR